MFINANEVKKESIIESDLCIVGGGAAGITLALCLKDLPLEICLLESGDLEKDDAMQKLNEIETTALPVAEPSRARQFGGTTTLWVGRWKPHDPIDFKRRGWVKHSGWPITFEDVEPYYKKAAKILSAPALEGFNLDCENLTGYYKIQNNNIETTIFRWFDKNSFDWGKKYRNMFASAENIRVLLRANVTKLQAGQKGRVVKEAEVKTLEGNAFSVRAKYFVLAAGGLENPRLLLLSNIGNQHGQVGRYYMDHPKGLVGKIEVTNANADLTLYEGFVQEGRRVGAGLRLSNSIQGKHKVLNSYVMPEPFFPWSYSEGVKAFWNLVLMAKGKQKRDVTKIWRCLLMTLQNKKMMLGFFVYEFKKRILKRKTKSNTLALWNFMEQAPRPENRMSLGKEKDILGLPKVRLTWTFGELDKKTMIVLHRMVKSELENMGIGRVESPLLKVQAHDWPIRRDASHHMGTTRMGDNPRTSVVDKNCKVHGVDNLYIAGGSVFATSGYANPTCTITALSARLAEHLTSKLTA